MTVKKLIEKLQAVTDSSVEVVVEVVGECCGCKDSMCGMFPERHVPEIRDLLTIVIIGT